MGLKGQSKTSSTFERTVFDPGMYTMRLTKALVMMGKPTKFQPEGAPKILMVWEMEHEGEKFELADYLGFPKNFAYNEKSNFWKRIAEIAGVTINNENAGDVDLDLGEFIQSYDELLEHIQSVGDQGRPEKAEVKSITVNGQELLGKQCQLVVKVWTGESGNQGNEIASVMQLGGGGGPKRPSAAKAAAPAPQQAKPATPRPAPAPAAATADLPF